MLRNKLLPTFERYLISHRQILSPNNYLSTQILRTHPSLSPGPDHATGPIPRAPAATIRNCPWRPSTLTQSSDSWTTGNRRLPSIGPRIRRGLRRWSRHATPSWSGGSRRGFGRNRILCGTGKGLRKVWKNVLNMRDLCGYMIIRDFLSDRKHLGWWD